MKATLLSVLIVALFGVASVLSAPVTSPLLLEETAKAAKADARPEIDLLSEFVAKLKGLSIRTDGKVSRGYEAPPNSPRYVDRTMLEWTEVPIQRKRLFEDQGPSQSTTNTRQRS